jgi:hypothetical protein
MPNAKLSKALDVAIADTLEEGATPSPTVGKKHFSPIRRDLTRNELANKGVQKMLLMHIDRLEAQNQELLSIRNSLGAAVTEKAVLQQKLNVARGADIVFGVCLTGGSLLIGLAPSIWKGQPQAEIVLIVGLIVMVAGIVSRWLLR